MLLLPQFLLSGHKEIPSRTHILDIFVLVKSGSKEGGVVAENVPENPKEIAMF